MPYYIRHFEELNKTLKELVLEMKQINKTLESVTQQKPSVKNTCNLS